MFLYDGDKYKYLGSSRPLQSRLLRSAKLDKNFSIPTIRIHFVPALMALIMWLLELLEFGDLGYLSRSRGLEA